ncbi:MAG: hypothetical protein ACYDCO_17745 [Armatimonadota bacterium]
MREMRAALVGAGSVERIIAVCFDRETYEIYIGLLGKAETEY